MKVFAMSDIHSYYDAMTSALDRQGFDITNPDHHVVFCGDLFDRGPDAVKCLNFARELAEQNRLTYIYGNHEELLLDCLNEILTTKRAGRHHVTNGTVDTISQFSGIPVCDLLLGLYDREKLIDAMLPVINFIADNTYDCAEFFDKFIFTHGWIPCDKLWKVPDNWREPEADWRSARWINGMDAWRHGARVPERTIICGHWHASWGHSHIHQDLPEYPDKRQEGWLRSFLPFVDDGIIALDACTAYTGFVNCWVFEE